MPGLRYLSFECSEDANGVITLHAQASTPAAQASAHTAALAEVQQVLAWAHHHFAHSHGPLDDGHDWDDDLQVVQEPDQWRSVHLTLAASPRFAEAFLARFAAADGD